MRRIVGRTGVASLRQGMYLPFWYNEQWRAWHISRPMAAIRARTRCGID